VGVHSAPGWSGIAICSLVSLGEAWNIVQFIVLMEWIRFHGTEEKSHKKFQCWPRFSRMQSPVYSIRAAARTVQLEFRERKSDRDGTDGSDLSFPTA